MANFIKSCANVGANVVLSPVRYIYSSHCKEYKNNGKDQQEMRNRRADESKRIQKEKRYEDILKFRSVPGVCDDHAVVDFSLAECIKDLSSESVNHQLKALLQLKININQEGSRLIDAIINAGVLHQLKQFVNTFDDSSEFVQFTASILKLIASGTAAHVDALLDAGYEDILYSLLRSKDDDVVEEAVWTLGFMIPYISTKRYRYKIALEIARMPLLSNPTLPFLRAITWTMSMLDLPFERALDKKSKIFLSVIVELLTCPGNDDDLKAILRQLSSPTKNYDAISVEKLLKKEGVIEQLVNSSLDEDETGIVLLSLRAMYIATYGWYTDQSQVLIDGNALPVLGELLNHPRVIVQRQALRCLESISQQGTKKITAVIESNLLPSLFELMIRESEKDVKHSILEILETIVHKSKPNQSTYLRDAGIIQAVCQVIADDSVDYIYTSLCILKGMLELARKNHQILPSLLILKIHGLDAIKSIQLSENSFFSDYAGDFVEKYFNDEIVEDEYSEHGDVESDDESDGDGESDGDDLED